MRPGMAMATPGARLAGSCLFAFQHGRETRILLQAEQDGILSDKLDVFEAELERLAQPLEGLLYHVERSIHAGKVVRRPRILGAGFDLLAGLGEVSRRSPFSTTSPSTIRWRVRDEIRRIHREIKPTRLHVRHNLPKAMALGERLAVVNQGAIQPFCP